MLLVGRERDKGSKRGEKIGSTWSLGPPVCVWGTQRHNGANSNPDLGQASSALQNSDSESIKGGIMRADYVVRPFTGFWQHFAKILTACMCVFDRLPMSICNSPQYYHLHTLFSQFVSFSNFCFWKRSDLRESACRDGRLHVSKAG